MLHAFNYTFPATTLIADGAGSACWNVRHNHSKSMQTFLTWRETRIPDTNLDNDVSAGQIREAPPDVVITLGSVALPFIVRRRGDIAQMRLSYSRPYPHKTMVRCGYRRISPE